MVFCCAIYLAGFFSFVTCFPWHGKKVKKNPGCLLKQGSDRSVRGIFGCLHIRQKKDDYLASCVVLAVNSIRLYGGGDGQAV
jgi:hypothetical protein